MINCGPREDSTRVGGGGAVRRQACDVSPIRRVNQAIYLITTGAREASFRNIKTIAECLADEIMNAAKVASRTSVACPPLRPPARFDPPPPPPTPRLTRPLLSRHRGPPTRTPSRRRMRSSASPSPTAKPSASYIGAECCGYVCCR